jgi:hypothetical protein
MAEAVLEDAADLCTCGTRIDIMEVAAVCQAGATVNGAVMDQVGAAVCQAGATVNGAAVDQVGAAVCQAGATVNGAVMDKVGAAVCQAGATVNGAAVDKVGIAGLPYIARKHKLRSERQRLKRLKKFENG